MKYWMLAAICSGLCASAGAIAGTNSGPNDDASVMAELAFREGVAFCNQASKLSRTDAANARTQIAQYLHHLEQAVELAPETIENNSFIQRESKRCALVEDNIARLEAMTLAETSLQRCGEARSALEKGALSQAQTKFDEYQIMSQQAVAVTPTVMRVGSLGVQFRRCDQLVEKISLAKVNRTRVAREAEHTLASFAKVLDSCAAGKNLLRSSETMEDLRQARKQVLGQVNGQLQLADQQAAELVKSSVANGVPYSQQVTDSQANAEACHQYLVTQFDQMQQQMELHPRQEVSATAMIPSGLEGQSEDLPSPYAASADGATEMTVEGGVVQLGAPEF